MSAVLQPARPPAESSSNLVPAEPGAGSSLPSASFGRNAARVIGLLAVVGAVLFLCLLDYPSVLGRWEIWGITRTITGEGPNLTFEISAAGPIYGRGHYGLVDLGYYTAGWLGWTRTAFRLPVLVAGTLATVVFFVLAGRGFGFWAAVVGTLALALNPMFLVYWHQLFVPMFSMLFFLLVIERVHWLETSARSRRRLLWGVPSLALAFFFVLLHYGPGRVYGALVIGYWAAQVAWRALAARRDGRPVDRAALAAVPACAVLVVAFAVLLDQRNVQYVVDPFRLIVVPRTEVVKSVDELATVPQNLPIVLTALVPALGLAPDRFGDFVTDLIVDYRYYVFNTSMLPLALLGLGVVVSQLGRSSLARLTLVLLAATVAGPVFSSQNGGHLTISSPRLFFALAPLYLCVAAGVGWLLARRQPAIRLGAAVLLLVLLAFQAVTVSAEVERHRAFMDDLADRWSSNHALSLFDGPSWQRATDEDELLTNGSYRYYVDAGGVGSRAIARRIAADAPRVRSSDEVVVVRLESKLTSGIGSAPIQMVCELHELGFSAAWYDPSANALRGVGFGRPSLVVVVHEEAARQVRQSLKQANLKAVLWTLRLPD